MNTGTFFVELGLIFLLILANGLFSMTEMAIVSARKVRLQQRAEDGDKKAQAALDLTKSPTSFLSTVQIGITLIATLTGALSGATLTDYINVLLQNIAPLRGHAHGIALALVVIVITYVTLVVGELVPKRLALANPEGIAASMANLMKLISLLARPVVWLLSISTEGVLRLIGAKKSNDPPVTPEEIRGLMEQGEQVGVFEEAETDMVESIFRLGDLRTGALMTPRMDIDWLDLEDPFDVNLQAVMTSPHSNFPVAEGDLDNVVGVLRGKDLLAATRDQAGAVDLNTLIQPAQFVPESIAAFEMLEVLKNASDNLALVIDEFGGMIGMVTLFDVMEAMVGGISEGGKPIMPEAIQREDGTWLVEGMMRIDAFKKLFDIDELPEEEHAGYQTVGGFVMSQTGAVPQIGQHFECCGLRIEVLDMDNLRVDKVLVQVLDQVSP